MTNFYNGLSFYDVEGKITRQIRKRKKKTVMPGDQIPEELKSPEYKAFEAFLMTHQGLNRAVVSPQTCS